MKGKWCFKLGVLLSLIFFFFDLSAIAHWRPPKPVMEPGYNGPVGQKGRTGRTPRDPASTTPPATPPPPPSSTPRPRPKFGGTTPPVPMGNPSPTPGLRGGVTRRARASRTAALERWEYWWECNKDLFLNLKSRLYRRKIFTNSLDFFLGKGDIHGAISSFKPIQKEIRRTAIPALYKGLKDSHYEVRAKSAIALGKIGGKEEILVLMNAMKDKHQEVREAAAIALGILQQDAAIFVLSQVMKDSLQGRRMVGGKEPSMQMRCFAALGLGFIGKARSAEQLLEVVNKQKYRNALRTCACAALGLFHSREGALGLTALLSDHSEHEYVRAHSAVSLGKMGEKNALPLLFKAADDKKLQVRRSAIISLGLLTSPTDRMAFRVMKKLKGIALKGSDHQSRCWALLALARIGGKNVRHFLLKSLKSLNGNLRSFACLALALQGAKEKEERALVTAALESALVEEKVSSTRAAICVALGIIKDRVAASRIRKFAAGKGDPSVREFACISLGMMEAKCSAKTLSTMLEDEKKPYIVRSTAIALGLLSERKIVAHLIKMMGETSNLTLKTATTLALGYVGDRESLDPLTQLLVKGKNHKERSYAAIALGKVGERSDFPILSNLSRNMNYRALTMGLNSAVYLY